MFGSVSDSDSEGFVPVETWGKGRVVPKASGKGSASKKHIQCGKCDNCLHHKREELWVSTRRKMLHYARGAGNRRKVATWENG